MASWKMAAAFFFSSAMPRCAVAANDYTFLGKGYCWDSSSTHFPHYQLSAGTAGDQLSSCKAACDELEGAGHKCSSVTYQKPVQVQVEEEVALAGSSLTNTIVRLVTEPGVCYVEHEAMTQTGCADVNTLHTAGQLGFRCQLFTGGPGLGVGPAVDADEDVPYECYARTSIGTSKGDPLTSFNGTDTRFQLPEGKLVPVLTQPPLTVSYRLTNPLAAAQHAGADWITEVGVAVNGAPANYVNISLVDPATLLHMDLTCEPPLPGSQLSTMRVSVGGKPLMAGVHAFTPMVIKATVDPNKKRIGCGYVERVDIDTAHFRMRVTSARAKKFAEPEMQIQALHLDVDLFKFDQAVVRGVLPELWGLLPLSAATTKLLSPQ